MCLYDTPSEKWHLYNNKKQLFLLLRNHGILSITKILIDVGINKKLHQKLIPPKVEIQNINSSFQTLFAINL